VRLSDERSAPRMTPGKAVSRLVDADLGFALRETRAFLLKGSGHWAHLLQITVDGVHQVVPHQTVVDELPAPFTVRLHGLILKI